MRTRRGGWWTAGRCGVALLVAGCQGDVQRPEPRASSSASRPLARDAALRPAVSGFDPLAYARAQGEALGNPEAHVPPQCYTRTGAQSNACWTCHTSPHDRNTLDDVDLQERYSFSRFARTNHWDNLFIDRRAAIDAIADDAVLAYVREDNYQALRGALAAAGDFPGYAPDVEPGSALTTRASPATAATGERSATSRSPAPSGRPTAAPTTARSGCRRRSARPTTASPRERSTRSTWRSSRRPSARRRGSRPRRSIARSSPSTSASPSSTSTATGRSAGS